jgi:hypothetical protein
VQNNYIYKYEGLFSLALGHYLEDLNPLGGARWLNLTIRLTQITQACTDFDVCIKLTVFEQFRPPDYENYFGFALSRLVFSQIVFS